MSRGPSTRKKILTPLRKSFLRRLGSFFHFCQELPDVRENFVALPDRSAVIKPQQGEKRGVGYLPGALLDRLVFILFTGE